MVAGFHKVYFPRPKLRKALEAWGARPVVSGEQSDGDRKVRNGFYAQGCPIKISLGLFFFATGRGGRGLWDGVRMAWRRGRHPKRCLAGDSRVVFVICLVRMVGKLLKALHRSATRIVSVTRTQCEKFLGFMFICNIR